jgi:hypothetical protein
VLCLFLQTSDSFSDEDMKKADKKRLYEKRVLTKAEFQELVASPGWALHEAASKEWGAPFYVGPNGQVALQPKTSLGRPELMISGGPDFLASLLHPIKVVTVMAHFQMSPEAFIKRVPAGVRVDLVPDIEKDRHLTRDVAPGGEGFLDALVAIGNLMMKSRPEAYWQVTVSEDIITSIDLVTNKGPFVIDASVYKQYWGEGERYKLSDEEIKSAARLYLKFH